jgi:hypothetical protein
MKKIICGSIAVLVIAATIAFNVNLNTQSEKLSDISLTNVEALADGESVSIPCRIRPSDSCTFDFSNADGQSGSMTLSGHVKSN